MSYHDINVEALSYRCLVTDYVSCDNIWLCPQSNLAWEDLAIPTLAGINCSGSDRGLDEEEEEDSRHSPSPVIL